MKAPQIIAAASLFVAGFFLGGRVRGIKEGVKLIGKGRTVVAITSADNRDLEGAK